ncbi:alpha/beta-hydrolase [Atractiella rhizophila]|nr:alpha/beta-hydrolase [Atractiella rhizophila]
MSQFCADCFKGGVVSGEPEGNMEVIASIDCYVSPPGPKTTKAIVLGYDVFGFHVVSPKIIADIISRETGMQVFVPDALMGDYVKSMAPAGKPFKKHGLISNVVGTISTYAHMISAGALGVMKRMDREAMTDRYLSSIKEIKEKRGVTTVGMVGYCLGAHFCGAFASQPELINAAVLCHPSRTVTVEVIKQAKIPLSFACAEEDFAFPEKQRQEIEEVLKELDVQTEMKVYIGCNHGFAARPDLKDPEQKEAFEKALTQTIEWFKRYL